jgi:hypothetical protein
MSTLDAPSGAGMMSNNTMASTSGPESREQEKKRFFDLADKLERAQDPDERKKIKELLARMTFGDRGDPKV